MANDSRADTLRSVSTFEVSKPEPWRNEFLMWSVKHHARKRTFSWHPSNSLLQPCHLDWAPSAPGHMARMSPGRLLPRFLSPTQHWWKEGTQRERSLLHHDENKSKSKVASTRNPLSQPGTASASFLLLWQTPETVNLKGGKVYLGSQFQSLVTWPHCFGPVMKQHMMVEARGRAKLLTSWWPGSKERDRKGQGPNIPFKGTPPMTSLPPTRPHLLKVLLPPNSAIGQSQTFNTWAFGPFQIQTITGPFSHLVILWTTHDLGYLGGKEQEGKRDKNHNMYWLKFHIIKWNQELVSAQWK
jgi:hypothetical protein